MRGPRASEFTHCQRRGWVGGCESERQTHRITVANIIALCAQRTHISILDSLAPRRSLPTAFLPYACGHGKRPRWMSKDARISSLIEWLPYASTNLHLKLETGWPACFQFKCKFELDGSRLLGATQIAKNKLLQFISTSADLSKGSDRKGERALLPPQPSYQGNLN